MSTTDAEFLRLLRQDIDYFERAIQRFEDLIPHVSAPIQDQWRLQAQVRRDFATELQILQDKANQSMGTMAPSVRDNPASDRR